MPPRPSAVQSSPSRPIQKPPQSHPIFTGLISLKINRLFLFKPHTSVLPQISKHRIGQYPQAPNDVLIVRLNPREGRPDPIPLKYFPLFHPRFIGLFTHFFRKFKPYKLQPPPFLLSFWV